MLPIAIMGGKKEREREERRKAMVDGSFDQWVFFIQELAPKEAIVWGKRNKHLNHLKIQK